MNFLWLIFFFPYVFPFVFSVMLYHLFGVRLPFWKWVIAMILGVILIHSSIFFMWRLGPNPPVGTSLDHWLVAMEKINLILVASLIGTCLYSVRSRRSGSAEGVRD
jgi:hypothetical protein